MNKNIKGSFLKIATIFLTLNLVLTSFYPLFFSPGPVYAQEEGTYWYCEGDSIMEVPPGGYPVELENCANSSRKCRIISTPGYSQDAECYSEPTPNLLDAGAVTADQRSADTTQELLITPSNIYPPLVENEEGMISACTEELVNPGYDVRCDPNYHKKLIIEQWRNTSCQLVERPGILTEENCGDFQVGTACTRQLLDAYAAKECDPAYGKLVWMEKWQDGNCEPFTKPGALTEEYCEGALSKPIGACEVVLLNPRIGQECDPAYGQYAAIELWQDANCRVTEKVGPLIPGSSCGTGPGSLTTSLEEQQFSQTREGNGGIVAQADTALENIDQGRYGLGYYKAVANNEEQAEELAKKAAETEKTAKAEEDYYTQLLKQQEKVWEETDWEKYWAEDARAKSALKIVESLGGKVESTPADWTFILPESCMIDPSMCVAASQVYAKTDTNEDLLNLVTMDMYGIGKKSFKLKDDWGELEKLRKEAGIAGVDEESGVPKYKGYGIGDVPFDPSYAQMNTYMDAIESDLQKRPKGTLTEKEEAAREKYLWKIDKFNQEGRDLTLEGTAITALNVVGGPIYETVGKKVYAVGKPVVGKIVDSFWNDGKNFAGDLWRNSGDRFFSRGSKDTAEESVEQVAQVPVKALDEGKPVWAGTEDASVSCSNTPCSIFDWLKRKLGGKSEAGETAEETIVLKESAEAVPAAYKERSSTRYPVTFDQNQGKSFDALGRIVKYDELMPSSVAALKAFLAEDESVIREMVKKVPDKINSNQVYKWAKSQIDNDDLLGKLSEPQKANLASNVSTVFRNKQLFELELEGPKAAARLDPNSGKWVLPQAAQPVKTLDIGSKVSVLRSNGELEWGWSIKSYNPQTDYVTVVQREGTNTLIKEVSRSELERLNRGTLNIGRPRSFNIQTLLDKALGLIFGSKVLAQEDTIPLAPSASSAGTSPVNRLMTQDEFKLIEAMTSVKHKLAEEGKVSSEEVKKALQENSKIKAEGIKTEDQIILTTGGNGQVEFEAEKGNYFVDSLSIEGVDIIIPSIVTLDKDTEVLAVGINKGQGEIKKLGGVENKGDGSSGTSKVKVITFYDKNSNGKMDGDEKTVPWAGVVVTLTKVYQNQEISLNLGWNLTTLTALPQATMTASSLISEIEKQGGEVSTVSSLEDGAWKSYVKRGDKNYSQPGDNFVIEPGKAYFIKALKPLIFKFSGQNFSEPIKVKLSTGWNALGLPKTSQSYQASELLDKSKGEQVSEWEFGLWNTLVKKENLEYGDNFRIFNNRGYILRVGKEGELSP